MSASTSSESGSITRRTNVSAISSCTIVRSADDGSAFLVTLYEVEGKVLRWILQLRIAHLQFVPHFLGVNEPTCFDEQPELREHCLAGSDVLAIVNHYAAPDFEQSTSIRHPYPAHSFAASAFSTRCSISARDASSTRR